MKGRLILPQADTLHSFAYTNRSNLYFSTGPEFIRLHPVGTGSLIFAFVMLVECVGAMDDSIRSSQWSFKFKKTPYHPTKLVLFLGAQFNLQSFYIDKMRKHGYDLEQIWREM